MKKSILTAASLTLALVACGPNPAENPKPSTSPSATESPAASPSPAESATPTPAATPSSVPGTPAPIATPTADPTADAQITGATAMKGDKFRYTYAITGSGLGSLDSYQFLQVKASSATIPLVVDGVSKENNVSLFNLSVVDTKIEFTWVADFGAPTSGDEIEVTFERKGDAKGRRSSKVRLTVTN
ncbi:hypothetical protein COW36_24065 [bacterium (Candidatus Blackallbacteria) CG17_big_fil_post_rev_8_21_14_2_50_48_46]|uniref:Lipoprotein n=1 Tax=bacterium (Candidatus Blackallbacteria) CG17_big_fil_post_rev_8_21_14_2_50_48_46 TaxID=2014261 RepID=A0A2M7FWW0_9BACT|nr:MAG: hypothetical protein COW64_19005 [bacterium (Candidatus Blackallbacteria) CG18_big_fil_WC_8_21_14_2_50_49_26]PIW13747.1 MAG: hypothetical protein COW36_24065 [bacterium (Candidatus Blackallbacteria) CG17_big_fil_post_rev_8_21_14_2_50_48_46]PIW44973.1 MAG: hypothetical protein COW20_21695 [bacterium (Candidatus Blackallbacteria) CG13_big_fil_rev_8_21_14_2_50_49_14]